MLIRLSIVQAYVLAVGFTVCFNDAPARADFGDELFTFTASDGASNDMFGVDVAMNGGIAIAGATNFLDPMHKVGAAYVFNTLTGSELFKFTASDSSPGDTFGRSVAIHSNFAIVGAPGLAAAYVFDLSTGQQLRKLTSVEVTDFDYFGHSAALNDSVALVGASRTQVGSQVPGSVYGFDINTGEELFELSATDATNSGDLAIVGAESKDNNRGAAYVYDLKTGMELHKLSPPGLGVQVFGTDVDIDGDLAIVNSPLGNAAYVFNARTGERLQKLSAPPGNSSVSISGNIALVGASVFHATTGQKLGELVPTEDVSADRFGWDVDIDGNSAIVAANRGDKKDVVDTGSAYLFDVSNLAGDFNNDGIVDGTDLSDWKSYFALSGNATSVQGDADRDQDVDGADFLVWQRQVGGGSPDGGALVPEPASAALLILALAILPLATGRPGSSRCPPSRAIVDATGAVPEGHPEHSPAIHCWENETNASLVPEGRLMHSIVPPRLLPTSPPRPSDESLGYSQLSRRDGQATLTLTWRES